MRDSWFSSGDLNATLNNHGQTMLDKVDTIDPQLIRFSTPAVVDELLEDARVVPLEFHWDQMTRTSPVEAAVEEYQFGDRFAVPGKSVTLVVPFSGDPLLFQVRANSYTFSGFPFDLQVSDGVMRLTVTARELTADVVNSELSRFRTAVEQQAGWSRSDIDNWMTQFRITLTSKVDQRRVRLDELAALDESLDIPLVASSKQTRLEVPLRPKRLRAEPVTAAPAKQDPRIADDNYREILAIISNLGRAQERLPKTAAKFNEEELRDLILFTLNANFAGAAKGEAFSGNGKTDIFLEWDGNNAFIAECKVWHGQKQFSEAIAQLLSYTVWKDSKAALILFIRSSSATDIIAKAEAALSDHPRRAIAKSASDTGLSHFMMKSSVDDAKLIDVAFIPFVVSIPERPASE